MNQLKMLLPALAAAMGVVGCLTEVAGPKEEEAGPKKGPAADAAPLDGNLARRYGVWIERNLRIVSDTGEPLSDATVTQPAYGQSRPRYYPVGKDGTVAVKCYGAYSVMFSVSAPGHYGRTVYLTPGGDEDLVLRRMKRPHPMRPLDLRLRLPSEVAEDSWRVDLVEGDWLPPHGYGRVADAVFCMVDDTDSRIGDGSAGSPVAAKRLIAGGKRDVWSMRFLHEGDGFAFAGALFGDELRTPLEVDCDACTNTSLRCDIYTYRGSNVAFRVRGHCGVLYGCPTVCTYHESTADGKGRQTMEISLSGLVNKAPGEPGIEPEDRLGVPGAPPPEQRALPEGTNLLAFGVSPDGRGAVCFGKATKSVRVPDLFPRAVYTADPAGELASVETLYLDFTSGTVPARAFAGCTNLRSVVVMESYVRRIEDGAFAGCPKLNAVLFPAMDARNAPSLFWCPVVAENAFADCAKDVSAIFFKPQFPNDSGGASVIACTNVWSRQLCVPLSATLRRRVFDAKGLFAPQVDLDAGKLDIPLIRFDGSRIEHECPDGRILVLRTDGSIERRMK